MSLTIQEQLDIINKINIPKNEKRWESYWEYDKPKFIITSDRFRDEYYLYSVDENLKLKKIETQENPKNFKKYKRDKEFLEEEKNEKK